MSIEVRGLTKNFGEGRVLDRLDLAVPDGALVALLGPSGSGKTTLLRCLAGLEIPDEGAVLLRGRDVTRTPPRQRRIGFVFQHYALFRHMSVFENIAFGLRVRRRRDRLPENEVRARVQKLLALVQLDGLEQRRPSELSGGQRQRISLARALAVEPEVLLLDEPFGALDARVRHDLRRWLRRLHDEIHVTSLFVTHDQEEALEVADRVAVLHEGRIEQYGAPDEVYHSPANERVMAFLGRVEGFDARVEAGVLSFGEWRLAALPERNGDVRAWIRPHDWEIDLAAPPVPAARARIKRIASAGAVVHVELALERDRSVLIEISQRRLSALSLAPDVAVWLWPRRARTFRRDDGAAGEGTGLRLTQMPL